MWLFYDWAILQNLTWLGRTADLSTIFELVYPISRFLHLASPCMRLFSFFFLIDGLAFLKCKEYESEMGNKYEDERD